MVTEKTCGQIYLSSVLNKGRTYAQTWWNAWSSALHIYVSAYIWLFRNLKLFSTGQLFKFTGITFLQPLMKEAQLVLMRRLLFVHETTCCDKGRLKVHISFDI